MEELRKDTPAEENVPKFRGLYRHVKVSVKALDWIIVVCIAVIVLVVVLEIPNLGFTVTFDTKGGTDVPAQQYAYGDFLEHSEPPTREGYRFTGWYTDYNCYDPWDMESDTIKEDMTLYAGWEKEE